MTNFMLPPSQKHKKIIVTISEEPDTTPETDVFESIKPIAVALLILYCYYYTQTH